MGVWAVFFVGALTLVSNHSTTWMPLHVAEKQEKDQATLIAQFEQRQLEAIKARILKPKHSVSVAPPVGFVERPAVAAFLRDLSASTRPQVIIAPKVCERRSSPA